MEENRITENKLVLDALTEIESKEGILRPQDVVKAAQNEDSPLHKHFEWEDSEAAAKYRIWQARQLIASVKVEFLGEDRPAYYNATVQVESVPVRGYHSLEKVLNDEELREKVVIQAVKDLAFVYRKYESLKEIQELINKEKLEEKKQEFGVS